MKSKSSLAALVLAILWAFSLAAPTWASLTINPVGNPNEGGSWYQSLHVHASHTFENLGLVMIRLPGDDGTSGFEGPDAWAFDLDGNPHHYSQTRLSGFGQFKFLTVASGDSTDDLNWTSHFAGEINGQEENNQKFVLTLLAYDNLWWKGAIQIAAAVWNGASWGFSGHGGVTWEEYVDMGGVTAIPVPSAVWLAVFGLGSMGVGSRRWRRALHATGQR